MANVLVKEFTYKTSWQGDTYSVQIFGDGTFIRKNVYTVVEPTEQAFLDRLKKSIDISGITSPDGTQYKLDASAKASTREQVREQWSKYNQDKASMIAFGEARSVNLGFARNLAQDNATEEFGKKQNTQNYTIKGARIIDEKTYRNTEGLYTSLVLVEIDAIIPEKAVVEQNTGGNSATLDDEDKTVITGITEELPEIEMADHYESKVAITAKAIKNGQTYLKGGYTFSHTTTEQQQNELWDNLYAEVAADIYASDVEIISGLDEQRNGVGYKVKQKSFKITTVAADRPKEQPKKTPPPPTQEPAPPPKSVKKDPVIYQPKTRVSKPKSTKGGEYIEKISGKDYKGPYIKAYKNKYYAGSNLDQNGVELIPAGVKDSTIITPALALLFSAIQGFFKKTVSSADREKGVTKRYFMQTKKDNKIVEVSKSNYQQAQLVLPTQNFATVDWIIKGPAEDKNFNGYPFEGAESKNKKAILALEKQIPGISTFIKDYKYLVEDPAIYQKPELSSEVIVVKDLQTDIDNSRKANFDHKK